MTNLLTDVETSSYSEPILHESKLHWIAYLLPYTYIFIGAFGILPMIMVKGFAQIIGIVLFVFFCKGVYKVVQKKRTRIFITEKYLTISTGIFSTTVTNVRLSKVEGIFLVQSLLGKLLNYGSLIVTTGELSYRYNVQHFY